jgi:hypothetical protein
MAAVVFLVLVVFLCGAVAGASLQGGRIERRVSRLLRSAL